MRLGRRPFPRGAPSGAILLSCALLGAALLAASGCSFVAVRRPPPVAPPPGAPLDCSRSRTAPGLDVAGAIATPLLGVMAWGLCSYTAAMQSWSSDPQNVQCGPVLWGTAIATAAYVGSATYGYHETAECRRLDEQLRAAAPAPAPPR